MQIPTILTPAGRERLAALHTGPHRAADGAASSSATSLKGSADNPLPRGQHAAETHSREPAADQRPAQGVGGQPPQHPPPRAGRNETGPDSGTDHPTNGARAPWGSPPQLQHRETGRARRAHHNNGPSDDAELRGLYGIHATTPSSQLVAALREHLRDVNPNRLFAAVPLPHAATTEILVRQLKALVTPGTQISDDLVEAWISWFNTHQPAQGGVWAPLLGWAHTLIAPPTEPRPAPSTGGRERAVPLPRPRTLRIPPHEGLAASESRTARDRGRNPRNMAEQYPEAAREAPPPRERDHSTITMIVLENGHYYQVRIIPHLQDNQWSLEAVDSMLPAAMALPDSPTLLLDGQPMDPLTAIVLGTVGTWHLGHALPCLWRWARRHWPHTRLWSATWRFHLDGRQQLEAILQRKRTAETPTAPHLCPVFAIHQIRVLALGEQLQPTMRTETQAQA